MWFDMSHKHQDVELYVIETESPRIDYDYTDLWHTNSNGYCLSLSISVGYKFNIHDKKTK